MKPNTPTNGFSLLEILAVLCIMSAIFSFAAPSFGSLIARSQVDSKADTTFDLFQLTRSVAIDRGRYITICPSTNGTKCESTWQNGIMAFVDNDHNRKISLDEEILAFQPSTSYATLHSNQPYFTYSPLGTLKGRMGSVIACPNNSQSTSSIRLLISQMGRVRAQSTPFDPTAPCKSNFTY